MAKITPILIHIDDLTDTTAKRITDEFISNIGSVKHLEAMAFYRDLQPICRENKTRARLVSGCTVDVSENDNNGYDCIIKTIGEVSEPVAFNALLILQMAGNTFSISNFICFSEDEFMYMNRKFHLTINMELDNTDGGDEEMNSNETGGNVNDTADADRAE